jgi:hypothetical protein
MFLSGLFTSRQSKWTGKQLEWVGSVASVSWTPDFTFGYQVIGSIHTSIVGSTLSVHQLVLYFSLSTQHP